MNGSTVIHGIVLFSQPVGEADRRLVILSGELGRVTAFARGARRPNSPLISVGPFTYGEITLYQSRNYNVVDSIDSAKYFDEVTRDFERSCYGSYFAEFADYYAREGLEARESVRLLYASLLALSRAHIPLELVRAVYELRMMAINGEYSAEPFGECEAAADYAWRYVLGAPLEKLFSFDLEKKAAAQFEAAVGRLREHYIDHSFRSLELLGTV